MNELNLVELKQELMEYGLKVGEGGTIVHCMRENAILRLEFVRTDGYTQALLTLSIDQIQPLEQPDIPHVRSLDNQVLCRRTHSDWAGSISLLLKLYWRELRAIRKYPGTLVTSL